MVAGNLDGNGALGVVVHSVKIGGNASLINGGGGPAQLTGGPGSGACFDPSVVPVPSPWSADPTLFGVPVYSDFEDNSIGGDLKLIGLQTCWTGALRNAVAGNILDLNNTWGDPDANEVVTNTVGGSMVCLNNNHVVQFGDSIGVPIPQTPNIVSGNAVGECGFGVIDPEAGGLHISVKA